MKNFLFCCLLFLCLPFAIALYAGGWLSGLACLAALTLARFVAEGFADGFTVSDQFDAN